MTTTKIRATYHINKRRSVLSLLILFLAAGFMAAGVGISGDAVKPASISEIRRSGRGDFYRVSSTQPEGNRDYITIEPGKSTVIFDVAGPGIINRVWVTALCADPSWPRMLVVEMFWDEQPKPSARAPLGDFFGAGMGKRFEFVSDMLAVLPYRGTGLNSFWPMPFAKGAKIVIRNDSVLPVQAFYFQVDYEKLKSPPATTLRFHAGYRQVAAINFEEGMKRFEALRIRGEGCFAGYSMGIHNGESGWFGEGDEILSIDGRAGQGTGLEDAVGGAWKPDSSYSGAFFGFLTDSSRAKNYKGFTNLHRFYLDPMICFSDSIAVAFERRPQDDWSGVSYWYQPEPGEFPPELPSPNLREPPRSAEDAKTIGEIRRLFTQVYKISGWPKNFASFDSVGDLISRVDALLAKEDYAAALRLLKAAAREQ